MSLRVCLDCTTAFAVGAPRCPHCGSERHAEEGSAAALGIRASLPVETEEDSMPKITRHGGVSVPPVEEAAEHVEGGEDVSAGEDSSTSSEKPSTKPETSEAETPKRARTTGSRSKQGRTGGSSARSTDGGRETDSSATGSAADE